MRKLPSSAQGGRTNGFGGTTFTSTSFSRPHRMTPWRTVSWPGSGLLSKSLTAGWEIPSRKPKLGAAMSLAAGFKVGGSASLLLVALLVARADDAFQGKDLLKRNAATDVEEA